MKNDNYFTVQGFMVNDLKLSGTELMTYAIIYGFSQDGESWFKGSRPYIASCMNVSLPTVDKALKGLESKGLIIHDTYASEKGYTGYKYRAVISAIGKETLPLKNLEGGSKETLGGTPKETLGGVVKNLYPININNTNIDNNIGNKKRFSAKEAILGCELSENLKQSLTEWVDYKKQRKETYTEIGFKKLLTEVKNKQSMYGDVAIIDAIESSMMNNYKGISWWNLEKKPKGNNNSLANKWGLTL